MTVESERSDNLPSVNCRPRGRAVAPSPKSSQPVGQISVQTWGVEASDARGEGGKFSSSSSHRANKLLRFVLLRPSVCWMIPPTVGKFIPFRSTSQLQLGNNDYLTIWTSSGSVKLTCKINRHSILHGECEQGLMSRLVRKVKGKF